MLFPDLVAHLVGNCGSKYNDLYTYPAKKCEHCKRKLTSFSIWGVFNHIDSCIDNYKNHTSSHISSRHPKMRIKDLGTELRSCSHCRSRYQRTEQASKCLLSHGYRRCWICLASFINTERCYQIHLKKFHWSKGIPRNHISCPICEKIIKIEGINSHIGHHIGVESEKRKSKAVNEYFVTKDLGVQKPKTAALGLSPEPCKFNSESEAQANRRELDPGIQSKDSGKNEPMVESPIFMEVKKIKGTVYNMYSLVEPNSSDSRVDHCRSIGVPMRLTDRQRSVAAKKCNDDGFITVLNNKGCL